MSINVKRFFLTHQDFLVERVDRAIVAIITITLVFLISSILRSIFPLSEGVSMIISTVVFVLTFFALQSYNYYKKFRSL